jgi:hypothetical protein
MSQRPPGPIELSTWPSQLTAHVVTPGDDARVHGYSVERDVAKYGGFAELILLSLRGELPSTQQCRALEVALAFMAPLSVAEAPTHAAVLARICGARSSAVLAIAALGLAERARHTLERYAPFLSWLESSSPPDTLPITFKAGSSAERESVARLDALLEPIAPELPVFRGDPDRTAALIAVLHFVGLRRRDQLEPIFVLASLTPVLAETFTREVGSFREYPIDVPHFEYTEVERGQ